MWPFRRNTDPPLEQFQAAEIRFLGEQDGPPERQLKAVLHDLFRNRRNVERAYLAIVSYPHTTTPAVALCLRTKFGADPGLVREIGEVFEPIFASRVPLDIMFLNGGQENDLAKVRCAFHELTR